MDDQAHLIDIARSGPLDAHARLLRDTVATDAALVTVLDRDHQWFLGVAGLSDELTEERRTPMAQSLCRTVKVTGQPLRIDDIAGDARWREHHARELGVGAYYGVPLTLPDGDVVGAVCALHREAHGWTAEEREQISRMRDIVEVDLGHLLEAEHGRERADESALLVSTLRHELAGELQIVQGGIETALLPRIDPELRDHLLERARRRAEQVVETLDALLRMDERVPTRAQEVSLCEVADRAASTSMLDGDRLQVDVPPVPVEVDAVLLVHVVRNLLDNAAKHTGGTVELRGGADAQGRAHLAVRDHGQGLPDHVREQLFEPFLDGRSSSAGFGLGLSIVRRLSNRLEADLDVDSTPSGTTVTVRFPQSPKPSNAASSSDGA